MYLTNQELRLMLDSLIKSQFGDKAFFDVERPDRPDPGALYRKIARELNKRQFN